MLIRKFPEHAQHVDFIVKSNPHDFGTYYTLCIVFDTDNLTSAEAAFKLEDLIPDEWDEMALELLKENNY